MTDGDKAIPFDVPDVGVAADAWCFTRVKFSKFSYLWTVCDVDCVPVDEYYLRSAVFSSGGFPDSSESLQWQVGLKRVRTQYYRNQFISLGITLLPPYQRDVVVQFKFSLLDCDGGKTRTREGKFTVEATTDPQTRTPTNAFKPNREIGQFIDEKEVSSAQVNGLLKIYCEMVVHDNRDAMHISGLRDFTVSPCDLGARLRAVQKEGLWSDFTLAVGKREFKVHRVVLAAQSPVFRRMIESPMAEGSSCRAEISDFTGDVVEEMVHFMYTGEAPNLQSMPQDLLTIADKYELNRLKNMCEKVLSSCLKVKNASATFVLAGQCNADKLKTLSMDFIAAHVSEVVQTPGWEALKSLNNFGELLGSLARLTLPSEVWENISTSVVARKASS